MLIVSQMLLMLITIHVLLCALLLFKLIVSHTMISERGPQTTNLN